MVNVQQKKLTVTSSSLYNLIWAQLCCWNWMAPFMANTMPWSICNLHQQVGKIVNGKMYEECHLELKAIINSENLQQQYQSDFNNDRKTEISSLICNIFATHSSSLLEEVIVHIIISLDSLWCGWYLQLTVLIRIARLELAQILKTTNV